MNSITETIKQVFLGGEIAPVLNAVDLLKEDHRKVEDLFKEFEAAETKAERLSITQRVLIELSVHAAVEEELVYPILMRNEQEKKTYEALEEHQLVELLLNELSRADGSEANFEAKMKVLADIVKHHIKEEELDLLPKLNETETDLNALGDEIRTRKETLLGNPPVFESKPEQAEDSKRKTTASKAKAKTAAGKTAKRKTAATKSVAKRSTVKKTAAKKPVAKKTDAKKSAAKKSAAKKTAVKKSAVKKTAVKKTAVKKTAAKKSSAKKPEATTTAVKKKATTTRASAKKGSAGSKTKTTKASTKKSSSVRSLAAKRKKAS